MTNAANISASQVKELRERTGAGMMECKKALTVSGGDMERAIEELRKAGITKAGKKADRIAAEGAIVISDNGKQAVMVEVNSETDFVARDSHFTSFVKSVAETALAAQEQDVSKFSALSLKDNGSKTVEEARQELVAKVGENVQIRRIVLSNPLAAITGTYLHGNRIGVVVELDTDNKELARDIAMHIAASRPIVVSPDSVPQNIVAKEKEIYMAQAATSGKPQEIIEKMVLGRLKKYLDEVSLTGQPFVKDPDMTVGSLLNKHRAKVLAFYRYEVGEGIEKASEDFKEAVMSQVQGS
ncbi:MAG: elongation factor Ts [Gammaproteobacteria bacterium]|nr:elongation factor Ts [Gammaproteobacteria bacterium]MCW5583212.1 elongation factor Ts [Gammaproteobacteria bacterium]